MKKPLYKETELLLKYWNNQLPENERIEFEKWLHQSENGKSLIERLKNDGILKTDISFDESDHEKLWKKILSMEPSLDLKEAKVSIWPRLSVAAAILVVVALSAVYILKKNEKPGGGIARIENTKRDIAPGNIGATLKLADGRTIALDSAMMGQLAEQGSTKILNKDGQLVYAPVSGGDKEEVLWNTLSTAKGQTYPLQLSDGSLVTLNSESSISFPVSFTGDLREVKVTGEVFFQVAHDERKPFRVNARDMDLQVLGTTFNVNAYPEENAIKATLMEGSIQVKKGVQKRIIEPGQQAQMLPNEIKVIKVDVDQVTAWKQGFFRFREDKLSEAMKNIARWYNVEVVFEGNAANVDVSGNIPRSANLSELVKLLALIEVDARIEGKKLILKTK